MSDADDTTGAPAHAPPARDDARRPLDYYYDDGTGYEVYDPEREDGEAEEGPAGPDRVRPCAGRNLIDQFPL